MQNFNLIIPKQPASIITIAEESGSGKTTLAQLVLGFTQLSSGQIIYDGQEITNQTAAQLKTYRREVQAVFQDPFGVYNPRSEERRVGKECKLGMCTERYRTRTTRG